MRVIANHGMRFGVPYWHEFYGRNARMTNLTAAIGLAQVEQWDSHIEGRKRVRDSYVDNLKGVIDFGFYVKGQSAVCLIVGISKNRDRIVKTLRDNGVDARNLWHPLCDMPIYDSSCPLWDYPVSRKAYQYGFLLPTYEELEDAEIKNISEIIKSV